MQFALMTEPQLGMTYDTLLTLARFSEERGLGAFARSDHYAFDRVAAPHATDAFATLAGLARETRDIELVVLVSPITFRHPGVIAKMATTIDEMSGGRLALGVGTGWQEREHQDFGIPFFDRATRFALLEEALAYLHHAFGRRPGPFRGEHYQLDEAEVHPRPTGPLPIIVGGSGERRTPRLAGTYADEYNFGIRSPEEIALRIGRARTAAERAGRDPEAIRISVMTPVIVGADQAGYERNLARVMEANPWLPDDLAERYRSRGFPVGTAAEVRPIVERLEEAGVSRVYAQHFGPHDPEMIAEGFAALGV